jgi:hypothetical protein
VTALLALGATGCAVGGVGQGWSSDGTSTTTASTSVVAGTMPSTHSVGAFTADEEAGLLHMVEEEKLAHDVYVTLGDAWDLQTFANISGAETNHTDQVRSLLADFGIADPTVGMEVGEFTDPAFTALYDHLVAEGLRSETAALAVGAQIEELDIVDLDERIAQTDDSSILAVYANLRSGSENHLRAFTRALGARGETYVPVHLDQAAYDSIVASTSGRSGRRG